MSGPVTESEHAVTLPEDDPQIFALYSHWLYFAKIPVIVESAKKEDLAKNRAEEYCAPLKAYVLGPLKETFYVNHQPRHEA